MKILIAVDGSPFTKRMLGYVAAHDELFGPAHEYTLLTAVPAVPPRAAAAPPRIHQTGSTPKIISPKHTPGCGFPQLLGTPTAVV
ncbi:hypothetical protein U6V33_12375 [Cutibacterium acnes]